MGRYLIIDTEKIKGIEYESDSELLDIINNAFLSEEQTLAKFKEIYISGVLASENNLQKPQLEYVDSVNNVWEQFKETL